MYKLGMNLGTMYANAIKAMQDLQRETLKLQQKEMNGNMLTIKGIEKLFRQDIGEWRIAGVETHKNTYIILLRKPNGEKHQINIERNPIGDNEYEMWMWKGDPINDPANCVPERLMLTRDMLKTMDHALTRMNLLMM